MNMDGFGTIQGHGKPVFGYDFINEAAVYALMGATRDDAVFRSMVGDAHNRKRLLLLSFALRKHLLKFLDTFDGCRSIWSHMGIGCFS